MRCSRCGVELPENTLHLTRNWPGRKKAVEQAFPSMEVSFCGVLRG
ncbi:hypothetical protein LCGC14_2382940 [marine sediment metagenome]|uniref:Uncharacterized protein n=1 Tax=marine sediment metagenome TaxID=412755 RepID=A0A0F9ECQ7_9ZZZZ